MCVPGPFPTQRAHQTDTCPHKETFNHYLNCFDTHQSVIYSHISAIYPIYCHITKISSYIAKILSYIVISSYILVYFHIFSINYRDSR